MLATDASKKQPALNVQCPLVLAGVPRSTKRLPEMLLPSFISEINEVSLTLKKKLNLLIVDFVLRYPYLLLEVLFAKEAIL